MALVVQKYGGSSVGDADKMRRVAQRIADTRKEGNQVVAVVSAMGDATDDLLELADKLNPAGAAREMDLLMVTGEMVSAALLAMTLQGMGEQAVALTGPQAGFRTDNAHRKARIMDIEPGRIYRELARGMIVIVAGFQGENDRGDFATLGRGGSDTTAVALAAVLKADVCDVFTDVDGIFTADPRLVKDAKMLKAISYDEILELASVGAQVMQARSIEFAKKHGVTVHVRSSFHRQPGTLIVEEEKVMENYVISGVAADKAQAKLTLTPVPDVPGIAARIFVALGQANVNVDMIIQSSPEVKAEKNTISFTVARGELAKAEQTLREVVQEWAACRVVTAADIAKVSVIGVGMKSHAGVAGEMFQVLGDAGINIEMISTSEIKISCVIPEEKADAAVRLLHAHFIK